MSKAHVTGIFLNIPLAWDSHDAEKYGFYHGLYSRMYQGIYISNCTRADSYLTPNKPGLMKYRLHELSGCSHLVLVPDLALTEDEYTLMAIAAKCGIAIVQSSHKLPELILTP
jgi:hypothetical protein